MLAVGLNHQGVDMSSKQVRIAITTVLLFFGLSTITFAQSVTAIKISFKTTSDDKDWNTQVRDRLILNGKDVATLNCCSADRHGDHWNNNSNTSAPMALIATTLKKSDLPNCTLELGMIPVGKDTWVFVPTLTVTYSDGTIDQWSFPETPLTSTNTLASVQYPIPSRP
jgi:hypothetical protein